MDELEQIRKERDRLAAVILILERKARRSGPEDLAGMLGQAVFQNDLRWNDEAQAMMAKVEVDLNVF